MVLDALDAASRVFGSQAALDHFNVFEFVAGRVRLVEAANGLHRDIALARFLGERFAPAVEILNAGVQLLAGGAREPDGGVNVNVLPVRVHHEHIFVSRELLGERRPRRVHEGFLVGAWLGAQNHMGEVARAARSHRRLPGFGELQIRVEVGGLGSIGVARKLREEPICCGDDRRARVGLCMQLAGFGQRGQLTKGAVRSVRPDGLRKIRVAAERLLDLVVKPIKGFRIGVNALPFAVFVVTGTGCDGDELNRGRGVAFLDPPRETMAFEGVGERRARLVFRNLAVEGDVETEHVVGGLARVLFAPVGGEIGDGFLAGDEAPVFALERQFSLVALVVHQRRGAHGTGAVAREFDDGGL